MVFLHLSDLHLGKRMNGYSLIEDQRFFLFDVVLKECEKRGVLHDIEEIFDYMRQFPQEDGGQLSLF